MINLKQRLLTIDNHKTIKGETKKFKTLILYLSPFTSNSKGINLCPHASVGCSRACLFNSGFGGIYQSVKDARIAKTEWYLADRGSFMNKLVTEINAAIKKFSNEWDIAVRLNGTSDIRFEKIKVVEDKNIFELFPEIIFYDYTKNSKRLTNTLPKNYDLTFSRSETNEVEAFEVLNKGYNVAWVFDKVPETYKNYKVISGDNTDLRFLDEKGVIVGLTYKNNTGKGAQVANKFARESGFITVV